MRVIRLGCLLVALGAAAMPAEPADYHITGDPAQRLFRASPFAHGYIHGYEQGFTLGDEDIQFGRGPQEITKAKEYREGAAGYRREFGSRESFRAGFREGLTIGYRDALSGGEFRALGELRRLATGVEDGAIPSATDRLYDGGFFAGYRAARQEAAGDCESAVPVSRERFCSGFLDGYELGESDSGAAVTAKNRAGATSPVLLPRPGARTYSRR